MMKKIVGLALVFAGLVPAVQAKAFCPEPDSSLNILDKTLIAKKLVDVRDKYIAGDFRGSLQLCREILTEDKDNATAHYRMAEAYFKIFEYKSGMESLQKAIAIDPKVNKEADLLMANFYHRLGDINLSREFMIRYKAKLSEKEIVDLEIDLMEQQLNTAEALMQKPIALTVTNMTENINSHQDDYAPLVSPDGKNLYFVSRRPSSTGSNVAEDFRYYEDIYSSKWDETNGWQKAEALDDKVNTEEFDNLNYISKDGEIMFLTYNIEGFTKSSDIAVSRLSRSGKWSMGKLLKVVNTSFFDACPTLPDAMDQMLFISERPNGKGGSDLWKVTMNNTSPSGEPINVASLNTKYNETTPFITGDGKYMFFSSEGHGSMGGYDIFISKFVEGNWSTPVNLGYPINSVDDETHFKISPDGKKAYFSSIRKEGAGGRDIFEIDLTNFDIYLAK